MMSYKDSETKNWNWLKRQTYIPSSDAIGNGALVSWKLVEKFPIEDIKYNPANYPNPITISDVLEMINEFHPFGFYPIRINQFNELLDGQHRLKFAQLCGLKFIDVWVDEKMIEKKKDKQPVTA
jgi:hypothetical protein